MAYYLGIDTSNYTTSVAVVNSRGEIVFDERIVLDVEQGKRGLRQSDALFLPLKNLPILFRSVQSLNIGVNICLVSPMVRFITHQVKTLTS